MRYFNFDMYYNFKKTLNWKYKTCHLPLSDKFYLMQNLERLWQIPSLPKTLLLRDPCILLFIFSRKLNFAGNKMSRSEILGYLRVYDKQTFALNFKNVFDTGLQKLIMAAHFLKLKHLRCLRHGKHHSAISQVFISFNVYTNSFH